VALADGLPALKPPEEELDELLDELELLLEELELELLEEELDELLDEPAAINCHC
jgi:hypothetical protein